MAFSFGIMSTIDGNVSTVAFIITIIFLVTFDSATNAWEASLSGSVIYNSMLQKIYKELMMMGFVSFGIAMYQASNTTHSEKIIHWIEAAEFVGYIVFFVAIFFVIHALYIMFLSMTVSRRYADLDKTSISDILVDFEQAKRSTFNMILMKFRLFPVLQVMKNVEFKIGWAVFRDTYVLPSQFDYVDYVSGSLQRYALRLVDISKTSWLCLIMLVMINYFRMLAFEERCRSGFTSEDLANDAAHDKFHKCESRHRLIFHLSGAFLVCYVVGLFVIGRFYQFRIIGRAGVLEVGDYENFLIFEEASLVQHEKNKLKQATTVDTGNKKQRKSSVVVFKNAMEGFLKEQQQQQEKKEMANQKTWHRKLFTRLRPPPTVPMSPIRPSSNNDSTISMCPDSNAAISCDMKDVTTEEKFSPARRAVVEKLQTKTRKYFQKFRRYHKTVKLVRDMDTEEEKHIKFSEDLSAIFFMHSPYLFFKSVEIAILINSLYLSVWFCNYITSTSMDFEKSIMMIIPIIICLPVIGEVVKIASLIDCTATLNLDVVGTIIEDLEEKQLLNNYIQKRLKKLPQSNEECREAVNTLFTELAPDDHPDDIDFNAFRQILSSLNIHFSNRKFASVMRHADQNTNGIINRQEMNHFLFPAEEAKIQIERRVTMNKKHRGSLYKGKGIEEASARAKARKQAADQNNNNNNNIINSTSSSDSEPDSGVGSERELSKGKDNVIQLLEVDDEDENETNNLEDF